jgi:ketosteroid isomerase-like protein
MSEENVELIRRGFAAFDEGDVTELLKPLSEDLVTHRFDPDAATYHGKEGFLQATADWIEGFAEFSVAGEEFIDAGERVVVRVHQTARGEASGAPVEGDFWFVFAIAGGKVVRCDIYIDKGRAFEAAGLEE